MIDENLDYEALVERLLWTYRDYQSVRRVFFTTYEQNLLQVVRSLLKKPSYTTLGLELSLHLSLEDQKSLLTDFLQIASYQSRDIQLSRSVILALPRDWLIENVEKNSESLLAVGTDEEYGRLLELFSLLDGPLAHRLAQRAAAHSNPHIREVGQDFLERLAD